MPKNGKTVFLTESLHDLRSVGTVISTSVFVARAMIPYVHKKDPPRVIVELGMGTGSITEEIVKHLRPADIFIGIESNEKFLMICKENILLERVRATVYFERGLAQDLENITKRYGVSDVDNIVCTIPFRVLPKHETKEILISIKKMIKVGGTFSFIRYILAPETKAIFDILDNFKIIKKEIIMRNIPPAEVITMKKVC